VSFEGQNMSVYKRKIKWKKTHLTQKILQVYSKGLEYALVSDEFEQCHDFVWCKDFLHDVVYSCINNRSFEIYKFRYDPNTSPKPCLNILRILLSNPKDKKFSSKIIDCLDFINQIEDRLTIKRTKVRKCSNPPFGYEKNGVFLFEANKRWLNAPPMLSLYSLLLRVGLSHNIGCPFYSTIEGIKLGAIKPYQKFDKRWLQETQQALDKILRIGDKKIFSKKIKENYPSNMVMDTVHNRLGIIGFAGDINLKSQGSPVAVPSWHEFK